MIQIRPVSDLRNKFPEIEAIVNNGNPVYLTKNGYGAMVVLSLEEYANLTDSVELKLDEADKQATITEERLSRETVFSNVRNAINGKQSYQLRFLPLFEQDLISVANYITHVLKNEDAALRLINDIEAAILERLNNPIAFEPYHSSKKRDYPYYRIYVRTYVIYCVVIDDVMEVRRVMYGLRDIERYLQLGNEKQ